MGLAPKTGKVLKDDGSEVNEADLATVDSLYINQVTLTLASTIYQMPSQTIEGVTIKALSTNVGKIYVGGSDVSASNGFELGAGEAIFIQLNDDMNGIYVIGAEAGDKVCYLASE